MDERERAEEEYRKSGNQGYFRNLKAETSKDETNAEKVFQACKTYALYE